MSCTASSASIEALLDVAPPPLVAPRPVGIEAARAETRASGSANSASMRAISGSVFLAIGPLQRGGVGEPRAQRLEPIFSIALRNSSRSSALSIAGARAPIISTPNFLSTPDRSG
jgi:hypothetical protein